MNVIARSASDNTDDWPIWMVWDGHKNVTAEIFDALGIQRHPGAVFCSKEKAVEVVDLWNCHPNTQEPKP